ncbi:hypothetical protein C8R46DRAFT_479176 [Mycena filopes]|nr:hypothetical protein C8R46DRAFT_479176 [Mycena filopes]
MPEFYSQERLPDVPDDTTLEEFILWQDHKLRPQRPSWAPWMAVDETGRTVALDEIERRVRGLEVGMRDRLGIREDDIVLLFSRNHIDYPICIWATHRLLAIVSPCNPTFTVSELSYQLRQTKPSLIIAEGSVLATALEGAGALGLARERIIVLADEDEQYPNHLTVNQLITEGLAVAPYSHLTRILTSGQGREKIAFLSPSSGTTGLPKIVALTHYGVIANVLMVARHHLTANEYGGFRPGGVCLGIPPFYHIYGIIMLLHIPFFCGMTLVVVPKFGFDSMLKSVERHKVSQLSVVPAQVGMLLRDPDLGRYDLSSVRVIITGGAPLSADLTAGLAKLFPRAQLGQAYGQTEATGGISMFSSVKKLGFFCGYLLPGIVARVVKPDGSLAHRGEMGELYLKTPAAASGYWGNEAATRETFVDGWIRTGDLVLFNDEEEIVYIDRLKEIIKVNALQVSPSDLEDCLLGHPLVAEACVVGIPDAARGELPLAFIVLTAAGVSQRITGASELKRDLMQHVARNRARYKHLGRVEFIDLIPRNPSGKILRRILQDKALRLVGAKL